MKWSKTHRTECRAVLGKKKKKISTFILTFLSGCQSANLRLIRWSDWSIDFRYAGTIRKPNPAATLRNLLGVNLPAGWWAGSAEPRPAHQYISDSVEELRCSSALSEITDVNCSCMDAKPAASTSFQSSLICLKNPVEAFRFPDGVFLPRPSPTWVLVIFGI